MLFWYLTFYGGQSIPQTQVEDTNAVLQLRRHKVGAGLELSKLWLTDSEC